MIDYYNPNYFYLDTPLSLDDFISRKHKYRIYQQKPRNLLVFESFHYDEVQRRLKYFNFQSDVCVVYYFLGADGFFHPYQRLSLIHI